MATSSPSPTSPLAEPPTSAVTPPPQPSNPAPDPTPVINANPPDSSTIAPPPSQDSSPPAPPASPPPLQTPSSPTPTVSSPPPAPAASPPPPNPPITTPSSSPPPPVDGQPPSNPTSPPIITLSPPPPTPINAPPTSPPPPAISPSTGTPSVTPPLSVPPPSSPPPPATKSKSPTPSHSSPPPPPVSHPPPPPLVGKKGTYTPPPSSSPVGRPPSAPPSPTSSPSQESPSASPLKKSAPSPSTRTNVSLVSPPPPVSPTPGTHIPSSAPDSLSGNSTASIPRKGGLSEGGVVAVGVVVGIVMLGLIGMVVLYFSKRRRRTFQHNGGYVVPSPYGSSPGSDSNLLVKTRDSTPFGRSGSGSDTLSSHSLGGLGQSRSWFTYQELYEATNGFASESLLGEGGFGFVYKGVLANEREVAVKQLKTGGGEGEREFRSEVETISRIHHRHLVSLVGYCIYENKRLLVYEYVPNQTLYYHLHGEDRPVMDWETRIKIVKGAARGIAYLHEDCHPRIIHRDIKSSNILMDNKFEARVSDFGTARLALDADTHISTRVMGTFGYMAPEYATSGKLTDKSDVYSFGVVLLELITGRKPVDESQPIGDESLVEWARPLLSHVLETGQVEGLVDPRLEKNYVESELFLMIEAAAACVRHLATKRPRMGQIVRAFDGLSPSDLSNGMRVGQSEIYDSAQQSADIKWFRRMQFGSHEYSSDYFSDATRNAGHLNPTQIDQGAGFSAHQSRNNPPQQGSALSTQLSRNDPSLQQSQNIYFSSQRTQSPAFSGQWNQDPSVLRQSTQNPISRQHSSQNPSVLRQSSQNMDSSSRQSERS